MLPEPRGLYTTAMTYATFDYSTAFGKEPGKIQQRHGAFAVDEPFGYSDFSASTGNHGEAGSLRARKHVALTLRKFSKISLR